MKKTVSKKIIGNGKVQIKKSEKIQEKININIKNTPYLIIVESPSKCKKIEKFLGFQYKCIASNGHIRGLASIRRKKTGVLYEPIFEILPEKKTHVEHIRYIISQFTQENIFIATDDDREGEAIGWHICQTFGLNTAVVKRIVFNEITETALKTAVKNPMKIRMSIVLAQQTRQILDQMVGYEISPLLTRKMGSKEPLSAGRCQTPALRFIYDKCSSKSSSLQTLEMKYHVNGYFFSTFSSASTITFPLPLEISLTSTDFSEEEMKTFLTASLDFGHRLILGDPKEKRSSPPTPFHTSALLQTANSLLNLSPKKTMDYCQLLYQHGFITYMRTESTKYADIFLQQVENYFQKQGEEDKKWLGNWTNIRNQAGISPHEAIRVTNIYQRDISLETVVESKTEQKRIATLYHMIWKRSLESCMSDYLYRQVDVFITAPLEKKYHYSLEIPIFAGWKRDFSEEEKEKRELQFQEKQIRMNGLYSFLQHAVSPINIIKIEAKQVWQKESNRYYTESGLIQTLEKHGIGRPSTYAMMVETIQERKYVKLQDIPGEIRVCQDFLVDILTREILSFSSEKVFGQEKNKLVLQPLGKEVMEQLIPTFDSFFSYDYTREMETKLDKISSGIMVQSLHEDPETEKWYDICKEVETELKKKTKEWKTELQEKYPLDDNHELIFSCKYGVLIRNKDKCEGEGKPTYQKVRKMEIDIERLKRKEYTLEDLLEIPRELLGTYQEKEIRLKNGKYGIYFLWGEEKPQKWNNSKPAWEITLEDIIACISNINVDNPNLPGKKKEDNKNPNNIRILSDSLSIKKGKYGAYLYHIGKPKEKEGNSDKKSSPFYNIKLYPGDIRTDDVNDILYWIKDTYGIE